MNIEDRIVEYTVSEADAATLNNTVSAGDVYPVLVVGRTEADPVAGIEGQTFGHMFYHGGSFPISFVTEKLNKQADPAPAVQGSEPAAGVNARAADQPLFEQPADTGHELTTIPTGPAEAEAKPAPISFPVGGQPTETEAEMEARLRRELAPPPNTETAAEMEARIRAKILAEGSGVTGSEGRL